MVTEAIIQHRREIAEAAGYKLIADLAAEAGVDVQTIRRRSQTNKVPQFYIFRDKVYPGVRGGCSLAVKKEDVERLNYKKTTEEWENVTQLSAVAKEHNIEIKTLKYRAETRGITCYHYKGGSMIEGRHSGAPLFVLTADVPALLVEGHRGRQADPPKFIGFCFGTQAVEFFASHNGANAWALASLSNRRELYEIGEKAQATAANWRIPHEFFFAITRLNTFENALEFAKTDCKKVELFAR